MSEEAFSISGESPTGVKEKISLAEAYERHSKELAEEIQTAENFDNWSMEEVFEILDNGILHPEEISNANFLEMRVSKW